MTPIDNIETSKVTRKWKHFPGRNKFYCNGRLMTAPHLWIFYLTVTLITVTTILFFIYDCPFLTEHVTIAIPIIGAILYVFTMSALFHTSFSDPGIIPRASIDEALYTERLIQVTTSSGNSPSFRPPPRTMEILVKGLPVKLKYCFTCKIFRPPRASHCSVCNNCVERFDHHCPWVGNCVGRRNYRFFYMFIIFLAFLTVFIFASTITHLILLSEDDTPFWESVKKCPVSVIVIVICFFSVWSILGLAGFHTYLTTSEQTTNEDIKGLFTKKRDQENFNPYSHGNVCLNWLYIICGPVQPSLIDKRGVVTEEVRLEMSRTAIFEDNNMLVINRQFSQINEPATLTAAGYHETLDQNGTSNMEGDNHLVRNKVLAPDFVADISPCKSEENLQQSIDADLQDLIEESASIKKNLIPKLEENKPKIVSSNPENDFRDPNNIPSTSGLRLQEVTLIKPD